MINRKLAITASVAISMWLAGCKAPVHMSYDYGRAYQATFGVQSDLTRESAMASQYPLGGIEGVEIRLAVTDTTTESKDSDSTLSAGGGL